jgi:hypothetical protein
LVLIDVVEIELCAQAPADHQNRKQQQGALRETTQQLSDIQLHRHSPPDDPDFFRVPDFRTLEHRRF